MFVLLNMPNVKSFITEPDVPAFNVSSYEGENKTATVLIEVEVSLTIFFHISATFFNLE